MNKHDTVCARNLTLLLITSFANLILTMSSVAAQDQARFGTALEASANAVELGGTSPLMAFLLRIKPEIDDLRIESWNKTYGQVRSEVVRFLSSTEEEAWRKYSQAGKQGGVSFAGIGANLSKTDFKEEFRSRRASLTSSSSELHAMARYHEMVSSYVPAGEARQVLRDYYAFVLEAIEAVARHIDASRHFFRLTSVANTAAGAIVGISWSSPPAEIGRIRHVKLQKVVVNERHVPIYADTLIGPRYDLNLSRTNGGAMNVTAYFTINGGETVHTASLGIGGIRKPTPPRVVAHPLGIVCAWPSHAPVPKGWRECSGETFAAAGVPAASRSALAMVLGGHRLPNYQGYFLRGYGGTGRHRSAGIGDVQSDRARDFTITLGAKGVGPGEGHCVNGLDHKHHTVLLSHAGTSMGGGETRPACVAVRWIVRVE